MTPAILALNAGSSSLKFGLFKDTDQLPLLFKGQIDGVGSNAHFSVVNPHGEHLVDEVCQHISDQACALAHLGQWLSQFKTQFTLSGVGHRIVHGGRDFHCAVTITPDIIERLTKLTPLAPLHQPHNLAAINTIAKRMPDIPQVACFDTAFHRTQNKLAQRFALPREYYERGIQRYGFHGTSYEWISLRLKTLAPALAQAKVVVAHLGSGASLCAMVNGKSVETTMGFTALDGLPMGTRCGALDPGVLLYLMQTEWLNAEQIQDLLYTRSGLLGLSGISNDLRVLSDHDASEAREAIDYFVYHIVAKIGSLAASMGGIDGLVFTAGIGENSAAIRRDVCKGLAFLGIHIDSVANDNAKQEQCLSPAGAPKPVWVIPTNEECMIAHHTQQCLAQL